MDNSPMHTPEVTALVDALQHISEYWNRAQNHMAMADALWHMIETAELALQEWEANS